MSQTANRLITLILLLQRRPNQKAADLAEKLEISVRTLHRYFSMLDEMGIPVYSERGPHGGFSLVRGYKMPPMVFSPEEAAALCLGTSLVEEVWGSLYREAARAALAKLDNALPREQLQEIAWARRTLVSTGLHRAELESIGPTLEKLRLALKENRRVDLLYRSSSSTQPVLRQVDPYMLSYRWGWWYVIGYCHLRQEMRTFRVDRICEIALTRESYQIPTSFDARQYMAQEFKEQPQVRVRMRFASRVAHVAYSDLFSWDALEEEPGGSLVVTYSSPNLQWAASTVLAYGPLVTVLEPAELRHMLKDWIQAMAQDYAGDDKRI